MADCVVYLMVVEPSSRVLASRTWKWYIPRVWHGTSAMWTTAIQIVGQCPMVPLEFICWKKDNRSQHQTATVRYFEKYWNSTPGFVKPGLNSSPLHIFSIAQKTINPKSNIDMEQYFFYQTDDDFLFFDGDNLIYDDVDDDLRIPRWYDLLI